MHKWAASLIFMCAALFLLCGCAENLVYNANFSELDETGMPVGWKTDAYSSGSTQFSIETDGSINCASIFSFNDNDARWIQNIDVKPNTEYRFRARIKAENCSVVRETFDGMVSCRGANMSVLNSSAYSDCFFDTDGKWEQIEFYGVTGEKQDVLTLALRLGGYSGDGTGRVLFSDVSVEECPTPEERLPISLATFEPYKPRSNASESFSWSDAAPERMTETLVLIGFGVLLIALALIAWARRIRSQELRQPLNSHSLDPNHSEDAGRASVYLILGGILFCALSVRLYFAVRVRGYSIDVTDFMLWGDSFFSNGISFYTTSGLHDYPPVYMILLGIVSLLRRILGVPFDSVAHVVLIKTIPMLCDLAFAAFIFFACEKKLGRKCAFLLCAAAAFNPAFIVDSAAWGQVDMVMALALALCVYFAVNGRWSVALPMFALSMLTKPQAALFGPIGVLVLAADAIRRRKDARALKNMLLGLILAVAGTYIICAPFAMYAWAQTDKGLFSMLISPFTWMWNMFIGSTSTYQYLTINACNLYEFLGKNWAAMSGYPALTNLAWLLFALSYAFCAVMCFTSDSRRALPLIGATLMSLIFCFAPMMHERYLFPAVVLLFLAYAEYRDKRILASLVIITLTQYLNMVLVLQGGTVAKINEGHLSSSEDMLNSVISAFNMLSSLCLLWTTADICLFRHVRVLPEAKRLPDTPIQRLHRKSDWKMHLCKRDYILMAAVTGVYAFVAFFGLGATEAPQTFWENTHYEEYVIFDLGEERTFRMTYYGGISSGTFTVALSNDGEHWTEENYAYYKDGEMYKWHWFSPQTYRGGTFFTAYEDDSRRVDTGEGGAAFTYATVDNAYPLQTARYVRITSTGIGLIMYEFGFWDVKTETLYPISSVNGAVSGTDYSVLADEQDTVAFTPSYYNSMYFDEIYHARTAYELLHGLPVMEWSHPHLGKLLIMVGIQLFGMTPFGWRFMGTVVGILMLPALYLLIMQLTKKTKFAFLGMFLMSVDAMHFTQTRIATIDSYPVFFIIIMYLFMFRYFQMNMHREKLVRTLIPLGLSGLFMGFACASKWIGIYAAAGLAVIFFLSVYLRLREYFAMKRELNLQLNKYHSVKKYFAYLRSLRIKQNVENERIVRYFPYKLIATLLFCIVAFIVVPLLIYYFSYFLHSFADGKLSIENVKILQLDIFNYHSQLVDSHFFSSPWYEWPFIIKPMWYYSSDLAYLGKGVVSSISCMGNPAVWWTGLASIVLLLILLTSKTAPGWNLLLIAIGFASQYLPWVLVPRSTFIYHYFASVPFIITATVLMLERLEKKDKPLASVIGISVMVTAFVLFVMFYPLESGHPCSYRYALNLRWFNWYNFALQ